MATTFQVLRIVSSTNDEGLQVFVDVQIYDTELGIINFSNWYSGTVASTIVENPSSIADIITPILPAILAEKRIHSFNPNNLLTIPINSLQSKAENGPEWVTETDATTGLNRTGWRFEYAVSQSTQFYIHNTNGSIFETDRFKIKILSKIPFIESDPLQETYDTAVWTVKAFFENYSMTSLWSDIFTTSVTYQLNKVCSSEWLTVEVPEKTEETFRLVIEISRDVSNENDLLDRNILLTGIDIILNSD